MIENLALNPKNYDNLGASEALLYSISVRKSHYKTGNKLPVQQDLI